MSQQCAHIASSNKSKEEEEKESHRFVHLHSALQVFFTFLFSVFFFGCVLPATLSEISA